ncbi:LiaF transmembrane domain-containing protein [Thermobacillus composti]|uniref:LiaF transmembrane domain-containing protein n=1 Tax=Thermobacillus composti TaxID=377615 RepID=UPI0038CDC350
MNGLNSKTALGVILVIIGGMIVLRFFGFTLGPIFGWLFPIMLLGLGYVGLRNGKHWIGTILIAVGAIMLLGKLSGLLFLILAIAAIVIGISMIKGKSRRVF